MRFKQYLKESQFITDKNEIVELFSSLEMSFNGLEPRKMVLDRDFLITHDNEVIITHEINVHMLKNYLVKDGKFVVKFKKIFGNFNCYDCDLQSLEGAPEDVQGEFDCSNNELKNLNNLPHESFKIDIQRCGITSFIGIEEKMPKVRSLIFDAWLVKEGGIGLVLIEDLMRIFPLDLNRAVNREMYPQWKIIEKYLGKPDDIFQCQAELIDAGYEAFAEL